jgi:hypothetical protein
MVRGLARVDQMFVLTMIAYNLTRMRTLGQIRLQGRAVNELKRLQVRFKSPAETQKAKGDTKNMKIIAETNLFELGVPRAQSVFQRPVRRSEGSGAVKNRLFTFLGFACVNLCRLQSSFDPLENDPSCSISWNRQFGKNTTRDGGKIKAS